MLSMLTRNVLVPISTLPAEILSLIFHVVAFSEQPYSFGWVHLTHVPRLTSHRARRHDVTMLWTHFSSPSSRNTEWIAERLSRARTRSSLSTSPRAWHD